MIDESRIHRMIAAACLHAGSEAAFTADLRAFLESHGLDAEDVDAILAAPPRLALYRRLIRNNLTGVTGKMLARTRARLNDRGGAFDAELDAFLHQVGPRSRYLRDVPGEMLAWAEPRWRARADLPRWAIDLARHELVEYEVAAAADPEAIAEVTDVTLDRSLVLAGASRLMHYDFAVHELPEDPADRTEPAARDTWLLVYRDAEHAVRFLKLEPFAAALTQRLIAGDRLADAVKGACAHVKAAVDDAALAEVARLLADYGARGILLGARG